MANCCTTQTDWDFSCMQQNVMITFCVISAFLVLSIIVNIFCCVSKCRSGKGPCQMRNRRRHGPRQMEENPIYGNVGYMQTSVSYKADAQQLSISSSSLRDQQRVNADSQAKSQDCYANLTLKPPQLQSGRSSPQIQYSDVVHLEGPPESENEEDGVNTEAASTVSDLYASVQTQRTKTLDAADSGEGYANHL